MPVNVIDTLKPKNGLNFPVVEAIDVFVEDYENLADAISHFATDVMIEAINTVLSGKANTSDVNTAVANLQGQIDQIVISASAESVVAPEVAQARVDANGVEHTTLKDRTDSDYAALAQATEFENLFVSSTASDNARLTGDGTTEYSTTCYTSDKIEVVDDVSYTKYGANDTSHRICFYDINDALISATTESTITIPTGTSYIRFSGLLTEKSVAYFRSTSAKDEISRKKISNIDEKYSYAVGVVAQNVENVENAIFDKANLAIKISNIPEAITKIGYSAAPNRGDRISISELSAYDTYYLITKNPHEIWVKNVDIAYYSISYGFDYIRSDGDINLYCAGERGRLRNVDNNLPTENNKLSVPANTVIAITVTAGTNPDIYGFAEDLVVNSEFKNEVSADAVIEAVAEVTESTGTVLTNSSDYDATYDSMYADTNGIQENQLYISWGIEISQDTELYVESRNNRYFSICVFADNTFSTKGVRYRAYESEDTLPYENNPITVVAGQYIVLTCKKANTNFEVLLPDIQRIASFKGDIPLAQAHIDQVKAEISDSVIIRYSSESGTNITERVHVYVPAGVGYVEYDFVHNVSADRNANVWRVDYAYACDSKFNRRFNLTTAGEWEVAVHLHDRDDFSGGIAHGDQIMTNVVFFVDGSVVDISNYTALTAVSNFTIAEASELYDPADHTTVIANHGSEHIFTKDGLKIRQSLLWLDNQQLDSCFMAMHLPAKAVTDHMYTDNSVIPFEIETYNIRFPESKYAVVYGENSGVRSEFSIGEYPHGVGNGDYLLITDNGGGAYNKCYYVITTTTAIEANTLWKSETNYKFDVGK